MYVCICIDCNTYSKVAHRDKEVNEKVRIHRDIVTNIGNKRTTVNRFYVKMEPRRPGHYDKASLYVRLLAKSLQRMHYNVWIIGSVDI